MKKKNANKITLYEAILFLFVLMTGILNPGSDRHIVFAEDAVQVSFEESYAQPGEVLHAKITGVEDMSVITWKWYVGNEKRTGTGDFYTPQTEDLQKMIHVEAVDANEEVLGSADMFFSRIPVLYVNTKNAQDITSKETYLKGTLKTQGSKSYSEESGWYDGNMQIRGRGNATWGNPKKPYKIKLDSSFKMFGMGKSKHWVLLANYTDNSLLRNKISYDLSGAMGLPYMQSVHVELILNGVYKGNYLLCEQVKLEEDKIAVKGFEEKVKDTAKAISKKTGLDKDELETAMIENLDWVTSDKLTFQGNTYTVSQYCDKIPTTGGFLLELDYYDDEVSQIITPGNKRVKFKNPEYAKTNKELYNYVSDYLTAFEAAIGSDDFHTSYQGESVHYSKLFDMDSMIKFWLIQEIFYNWDGMNNSNYFYKDVDGPMYFGPIWDMDLTAGNAGASSDSTWQTFGFDFWQHPNQWFRSITKDPYFIVQAYEYYHSIRDTLIVQMQEEITTQKETLKESGIANKKMWKNSDTYTSSVDGFANWMSRHIAWMDKQFESPEKMIESMGQYKEYTYSPDDRMKIEVNTKSSRAVVNVTATTVNRVKCYVNGNYVGESEVTAGTALFEVANEFLMKNGTLNTVQIFDADQMDKSNFTTFEKEPLPETVEGVVTVKGKPLLGAMLQADTSGMNVEADTIQWMADDEKLEGETESTLFVTEQLLGKQISVTVTGKDVTGELVSEKLSAVTEPEVQSEHLIINQVYGGGGAAGPVSHSYIELYNPTKETVNLEEYQIGYCSNRSSKKAGSTNGETRFLNLTGELPSGASYLIRCAAEETTDTVLAITQFDQEWEQVIDNKQYQVMLKKGDAVVDAVSVNEEPLEGNALVNPENDEIISKNKCIRRISYMDTDQNDEDFNVINLTKVSEDIQNVIRPRSLADYVPPEPEPESKPEPKPEPKPKPETPDTGSNPKPGTSDTVIPTAKLNARKLKLQKGKKMKVLRLAQSSVSGDKIVKFTTSNKKIVSVDRKSGAIKGKKIGKATITAITKSGAKASCKIEVVKKPVATKSFQPAKKNVTLKAGKSWNIKLKNRKPLTANDKILYVSENPDVASVTAEGKIRAHRKGKTVIRIKTVSGKKGKINVNVK